MPDDRQSEHSADRATLGTLGHSVEVWACGKVRDAGGNLFRCDHPPDQWGGLSRVKVACNDLFARDPLFRRDFRAMVLTAAVSVGPGRIAFMRTRVPRVASARVRDRPRRQVFMAR